jgi:predicted methyltransferase
MQHAAILSHFQTRELQRLWSQGCEQAMTSLDLNLTQAAVGLSADGVRLPSGEVLNWEQVERVSAAENACFYLRVGELHKAQVFSETTQRVYSLMPTQKSPTMLVSGVPMHRIKGTDPYRDTREKIKAIRPIHGDALDTATGPGYTAIEAARTANRVVTIELDPAVLEIARLNPWSGALFEEPKIEQIVGDTFEVVHAFPDESFGVIIHDPPAFSLAGDLYSGEFYRQLFRVLKSGGRLFHYIGSPSSKSGKNITDGALRRLKEAGFSRLARKPRAFGVAAYK